MRKIFLSTIITLCASEVYAVTMEEALVNGYTHNEDLKNIRNVFLNEIEAFPQALAGFMPNLSANFQSQNTKSKQKNVGLVSAENSGYDKSITLRQPVFSGGSSAFDMKSAQYAFKASRSSYYAKEQDVFLKEINAYLNCFEFEEKYKISKISVKSNKAQLDAMSEKFKLGEATETEVATAREGFATAKAGEAVAYANYESAKATFYQIFGIEATDVQMPKMPENLPDNLILLTERALAVNPNIDSSVNKTKSFKAKESATKGSLLPTADFTLRTGNQQNDATRRTDLSTTSTFSVNVPILAKGGAEYSAIRQAKYQTKQAIIAHDDAVKKIKADCLAKWSTFYASKERVAATDEAVGAAETAYEGMMQEEMLGSKTIIDVLNAEVKLNSARSNRVEAKKELILAAYQIKALVGELTAKSMKLKVDYFEPEKEFKKVKFKIIGF